MTLEERIRCDTGGRYCPGPLVEAHSSYTGMERYGLALASSAAEGPKRSVWAARGQEHATMPRVRNPVVRRLERERAKQRRLALLENRPADSPAQRWRKTQRERMARYNKRKAA